MIGRTEGCELIGCMFWLMFQLLSGKNPFPEEITIHIVQLCIFRICLQGTYTDRCVDLISFDHKGGPIYAM